MHILVIEDNAEDAFLIHQAFTTVEDGQAYVCRTAREGRAYLQGDGFYFNRRKYPLPDAIICDLGLDGENGLQFIQWVRGTRGLENIPTFVLSGSPSREDTATAQTLGVRRVMKKPQDLRTLERTFSQLTEELTMGTQRVAA